MELKFRYRFEAAHRFTNSASPSCMTPHGHTWYGTLHIQSLKSLNSNDMVAEFSQIKSFWKTLLSDVFDHSYMCNHQDPLLKALQEIHGEARVVRFPGDPTTELISLLLFKKAQHMLSLGPLKEVVRIAGVTIEETPTNSIFCSLEFFNENISQYKNFSGWWTSDNVFDRSFQTS